MKGSSWIWLAVFTALAWSAQETLNKVATAPKMLGVSYELASIFLGVGALLVVVINLIFFRLSYLPIWLKIVWISIVVLAMIVGIITMFVVDGKVNWLGVIVASLSGILLIGGQIMILHAFNIGANVSQVAPITNTYMVIAVIIGMIFLKERPQNIGELLKVGGAVVAAVISGILASNSFSAK